MDAHYATTVTGKISLFRCASIASAMTGPGLRALRTPVAEISAKSVP